MPTLTLIVRGEVPSKKNLYRWGKGRTYIPSDVKARLQDIERQIHQQWHPRRMIRHPNIHWDFSLHKARIDRDNLKTTLLDCMVKARVLEDDCVKLNNGWEKTAPATLHGGKAEDDVCAIKLDWSDDGEAN